MKLKTVSFLTSTIVAVTGLVRSGNAQTTVFSDDFSNGSTLNGTSTPGGTPTASSTSYDIAASKASSSSMSSGNLSLGLGAATTSGFYEAQAVFSSTPITLTTVGDYINLTYVFTASSGLLAGGTSSGIYTGLYNTSGTTPVAGNLASSGLNVTAGSPYATGNAASWQGYVGAIQAAGGTSKIYTRPVQTGAGTSSANQDLIGNGFGGGTYTNAPGVQGTGGNGAGVSLTADSQYTISYNVALTAAGTLTITENLFDGNGIGGSLALGMTNSYTGVSDTSFDGLAIGARNSGASENPTMDINSIIITDSIQSVPEPSSLALAGVGLFGLSLLVRQLRC